LYTIGRLMNGNYLATRDYNAWIGDQLPRVNNKEFDSNDTYIADQTQPFIKGLSLIARISWKVAADEGEDWLKVNRAIESGFSNPFIEPLYETRDVYKKYLDAEFSSFDTNPYFICDDKYDYKDESLTSRYFEKGEDAIFCLYLPKSRNAKNTIYSNIANRFIYGNKTDKTLIVGDIPVWETSIYEVALKDAMYSKSPH